MAVVTMKALLETGVHFGHRTSKWNPRMKSFIFTERNGIHIIDLQQTLEALDIAYDLIRKTVEEGGTVLFVGTKRQGQETIQTEAERCGMPYVNARWLGGTLTNWRTIRSRIIELENLEKRRDEGEFDLLTKKEALNMTRKINKLEERLGGIRDMNGLPQLVYVVDVNREETAIHEANLLNIPVVALVDTNCDPGGVDYVIPSNDDAIRAIKLLTSKVAEAVLEGRALRKDVEEEMLVASGEAVEGEEVEMTDEELLGEATLAKLQTGEYDEKSRAVAEEKDLPEAESEAEEEPEQEGAARVEDAEAEAEDEGVVAEAEPEAEVEDEHVGAEEEAEAEVEGDAEGASEAEPEAEGDAEGASEAEPEGENEENSQVEPERAEAEEEDVSASEGPSDTDEEAKEAESPASTDMQTEGEEAQNDTEQEGPHTTDEEDKEE